MNLFIFASPGALCRKFELKDLAGQEMTAF
jgi:hypothetical protein